MSVISRDGPLTATEMSRISSDARSVGAVAHAVRYATLPMTAYWRGDEVLMQQPKGWRVPMGTRVLPVDFVRLIAGDAAADVVASGGVLMGANDARYLAIAGGLNLLPFLPALWVIAATGVDDTAGLVWLSVAFFGVYLLARLATLGWRVRSGRWVTAGV